MTRFPQWLEAELIADKPENASDSSPWQQEIAELLWCARSARRLRRAGLEMSEWKTLMFPVKLP